MNTKEYQDVNLYAVGTRVDIDSIEGMQGAEILNINDGGVAIKCELGAYVTISGKSPARIAQPKVIIPEINEDGTTVAPTIRKERNKEFDIKLPSDQPFTIRQLAEHNGLTTMQIAAFIKDSCVECGIAPRPIGQRGRDSKLFKKI